MIEWIILALLALLAWFWIDSMRARDIAVVIGKEACRKDNLLFLDYTVGIASIRVKRNQQGKLAFRRTYRFEFSDTGNNRKTGTIVLLGKELELLDLETRYLESPTLH